MDPSVSQEGELVEQRNRGEQARMVLETPIVIAAFASIETQLRDAIDDTPDGAEGMAQREDFTQLLRSHKRYVAFLETTLETGKMALNDLAYIEKERN